MRRSPLVVMTAVLAVATLTGCTGDEEKAAAPAPAASSVAPSAPEPTESFDMPESTTGVPKAEPTGPGDGILPGLGKLEVDTTGAGPYQVGEAQADLVASGLIRTGSVRCCATS